MSHLLFEGGPSAAELAGAVVEGDAAAAGISTSVEPQAQSPVDGAQPVAGDAVQPAVDPQAELATIAADYGVDVSQLAGFASPEQARATMQYWADQQMQQGLAYLRQQEQQQQLPQTVPGTATIPASPVGLAPAGAQVQGPAVIDLKSLGLEPDDPVAKVVSALEAKVNQQSQQLEAVLGKFKEQSEQQRAQQLRAMQQEADDVIDSWKSPLYGQTGKLTAYQQSMRSVIYQNANGLLAGARLYGSPDPPVKRRMTDARRAMEKDLPPGFNNPVQPAAASAAAALPMQTPDRPRL